MKTHLGDDNTQLFLWKLARQPEEAFAAVHEASRSLSRLELLYAAVRIPQCDQIATRLMHLPQDVSKPGANLCHTGKNKRKRTQHQQGASLVWIIQCIILQLSAKVVSERPDVFKIIWVALKCQGWSSNSHYIPLAVWGYPSFCDKHLRVTKAFRSPPPRAVAHFRFHERQGVYQPDKMTGWWQWTVMGMFRFKTAGSCASLAIAITMALGK